MNETVYGINYTKPIVTLFKENGIGHSEYAGRTAYNSFENSEHESIKNHNLEVIKNDDIESSELLNQLAWVHFHHSVLEHSVLTFYINGMSRGVLQELARHRIASYTVQSTRYTMASVINAFIASTISGGDIYGYTGSYPKFKKIVEDFDMFVTTDKIYNEIQIKDIFTKLENQLYAIGGKEFKKISLAKSNFDLLDLDIGYMELFKELENGKKKRNIGDAFKHIVNDNWKVNLVMTINLRSLKNFFELRDSGAAWFQIQWLAQAMKAVTPQKYMELIDKKSRKK